MGILELFATITGLIYLVLLIRENIWCWFFGAISSALSVVLFFQSQLYSEAILYSFYIIMAGYGYWIWKKGRSGDKELPVTDIPFQKKIGIVLFGVLFGLLLGFGMSKWTKADLPFVDAQTTAYSFVATFLEAHKVVFGWIIWIIVNGATIGLYGFKGFYMYAGLMVIYFGLSIYGYIDWKRRYMDSRDLQPTL